MNNFFKPATAGWLTKLILVSLLSMAFVYGCDKEDDKSGYDVNDSLTLFKTDNLNNELTLTSNDTVSSQSGVTGKFIPVSGSTGSGKGLGTITMELRTLNDSLLSKVVLTSFFRPEYHVINSQLGIPASQRGRIYKVSVTAADKAGTTVGTKNFYGMDVVTCDPLPPCIANNQITVIVETPANTPPSESLYLFGSVNGWNRGDAAFKLNKNPDVPNCYCVTIPFPPGYTDWQVNEVYVTRGRYENDGVNIDGSSFIVKYTTTAMGPLWKIKVPKWRDR